MRHEDNVYLADSRRKEPRMTSDDLAQRAADAYAEILNRTRPECKWVGVVRPPEDDEEAGDEV